MTRAGLLRTLGVVLCTLAGFVAISTGCRDRGGQTRTTGQNGEAAATVASPPAEVTAAPASPQVGRSGGEPTALSDAAPGEVNDAASGTMSEVVGDARPVASAISLDDALVQLEREDLAGVAVVIRGRVAQRAAKMKLSAEQGRDAAGYVLAARIAVARLGEMAEIMPHSTVELARAVAERGVSDAAAAEIVAFHLAFTRAMRFGKLRNFDVNHSHVVGRDWRDIDYSGEGMTWQGQKAYWEPKGVADFKSAAHIYAYFRQAYHLPHFSRVYRPAGALEDFAWPPTDR
ncbi:MAG: hypothetical protein AAGC55_13845 [Myxococcota bacterium]